MSGSVNKALILGNLGADPIIRTTQDGKRIASLSVATSESWKDRNTGERREKCEWHRVVIFNDNLSSIAEQYLRKGSKVYLEGQIQTRKWTDQSGVEKYSTEVVLQGFNGTLTLIDRKAKEEDNEDDYKQPSPQSRGYADIDDEIPFAIAFLACAGAAGLVAMQSLGNIPMFMYG